MSVANGADPQRLNLRTVPAARASWERRHTLGIGRVESIVGTAGRLSRVT
jgi:hypothetical protein